MGKSTHTKENPIAKGDLELFDAPAHMPDTAREICDAAREEFEGSQRRRFVPMATTERLRAMLDELAPHALALADECHITLGTSYTEDGDHFEEKRAQIPPLLAHFAFVALALWQSEQTDKNKSQISAP